MQVFDSPVHAMTHVPVRKQFKKLTHIVPPQIDPVLDAMRTLCDFTEVYGAKAATVKACVDRCIEYHGGPLVIDAFSDDQRSDWREYMEACYEGFTDLYNQDCLKPNAMSSVFGYIQLIEKNKDVIFPDTERREYFEGRAAPMGRLLKASILDVVEVNGEKITRLIYRDYPLKERIAIVEDMKKLTEYVVAALCTQPGRHPAFWALDFIQAFHEDRI